MTPLEDARLPIRDVVLETEVSRVCLSISRKYNVNMLCYSRKDTLLEPKLMVLNITLPVTTLEPSLLQTGDIHYGVRGVSLQDWVSETKKKFSEVTDKFVIFIGDNTENSIAGSPGHGYDVELKDPQVQIEHISKALTDINKALYGQAWKKYNGSTNGCLSVGLIGNHEYRSRKTSGLWISEQQYGPAKIFDVKMGALIKLRLVHKKLKLERTYTIYASHRPYQSDASSLESIVRQCRRKKADIAADIYCYGHFHRKVAIPDSCFDENGQFKKVLYSVNPSPITNIEYADWAGYNPLTCGYYQEIFLPLNPSKSPWAVV